MVHDTEWTRRARRLALTVPLAAVAAVGLVGCNHPQQGTSAVAQPSVSAFPSPSGSASPSPAAASSAPPRVKVNGTDHNGLTISNGTSSVVMNGKVVDFGTEVRDLAWSPDGHKAAFVNGDGDLVISNPDGSGQTVVAKNPGGQTWSHPAWQVRAYDAPDHVAAVNSLLFAVSQAGVSKVEEVSADAAGGTPKELVITGGCCGDGPALPTTGNAWPNDGGPHGEAVFANADAGKVYIWDDYLRTQTSPVSEGSEPAISSDGEIVFVRSADGHDHLFEWDDRAKAAKDLTPNATTDYTEPAFSPDGKTIAVRTPDGISTLPSDGSAAPTHVSDYTGLPAFHG